MKHTNKTYFQHAVASSLLMGIGISCSKASSSLQMERALSTSPSKVGTSDRSASSRGAVPSDVCDQLAACSIKEGEQYSSHDIIDQLCRLHECPHLVDKISSEAHRETPKVLIGRFLEIYFCDIEQKLASLKDPIEDPLAVVQFYEECFTIFIKAIMEWDQKIPGLAMSSSMMETLQSQALKRFRDTFFERNDQVPRAVMELVWKEISEKGSKHTANLDTIVDSYEILKVVKFSSNEIDSDAVLPISSIQRIMARQGRSPISDYAFMRWHWRKYQNSERERYKMIAEEAQKPRAKL